MSSEEGPHELLYHSGGKRVLGRHRTSFKTVFCLIEEDNMSVGGTTNHVSLL